MQVTCLAPKARSPTKVPASSNLSGVRLDQAVAQRGLTRSRSAARQLILDGQILVNGVMEKRPACRVMMDATFEFVGVVPPYVSRAGSKLASALDHWHVDVRGQTVLDVGASTGGFTDCLLRRGAACVIAVDVGRDQLDLRLREDDRVQVREQTDVRDLSLLHPEADLVVIDVSFIRLCDVLGAVAACASSATQIIGLLKPQFELSGQDVPRDGVIKDHVVRNSVLDSFLRWSNESGFNVVATVASEVAGGDGNQESFVLLRAPWPTPRDV